MKDTVRLCRKCGKPVYVITWGVYRSVLVDAQAVMVTANPEGEEFVREDGSKVLGWEDDYEEAAEPAYRMHRKTCKGENA